MEEASAGQDSQLRDYCASGLYILTLLLDGYGFSEDTWPSIEFRKQVAPSQPRKGGSGLGMAGHSADLPCVPQAGGTDIGWTLGYMLNLTNMIPAEVPAQWRAQSHGVWVASVTFVVLTLGAVLTAAWALLLWPWD